MTHTEKGIEMSKRSKVRRGAKRVRRTISVTLPDGTVRKVRRMVTEARASRRKANRTFESKARDSKYRLPGGPERTFNLGTAQSWPMVVEAGKVYGLKAGR